jgi:hypothetical protein
LDERERESGGERTGKMERRIREREKIRKKKKKTLKTDFIKFIKIMIFTK